MVKVSKDSIESAIVAISRRHEPLSSSFIAPKGVTNVFRWQSDYRNGTLIRIPNISHRLPGVIWNTSCKMKWRLSIVDLHLAMLIQQQKVDGSSWWFIMLPCNQHAMAPFHWFTKWNPLDYAEWFVTQQITMLLPLLVDWNRNGLELCNWFHVVLRWISTGGPAMMGSV